MTCSIITTLQVLLVSSFHTSRSYQLLLFYY